MGYSNCWDRQGKVIYNLQMSTGQDEKELFLQPCTSVLLSILSNIESSCYIIHSVELSVK